MHITIINDCCDANAAARQLARSATLAGASTSFVGVESDLQAAGNLIDALDAFEGRRGAVLVNVAPRNGPAKKWPNGTPFGYFYYGKTLVVATIDGATLAMVKKLGLVDEVTVLNIPGIASELVVAGLLPEHSRNYPEQSQFRSFDFVPRVAAYLLQGNQPRGTALAWDDVPAMPSVVWWVDNFGNCKTSLFPDELEVDEGQVVETKLGVMPYVLSLKDVPDGDAALTQGSSGLRERRFVELVVQGASAADKFGLSVGSKVLG